MQGSDNSSVIAAGLPNVTGSVGTSGNSGAFEGASGAFWLSNQVNKYVANGSNWNGPCDTLNIDASRSSSVYGSSSTVQPPAISLIPQIKF